MNSVPSQNHLSAQLPVAPPSSLLALLQCACFWLQILLLPSLLFIPPYPRMGKPRGGLDRNESKLRACGSNKGQSSPLRKVHGFKGHLFPFPGFGLGMTVAAPQWLDLSIQLPGWARAHQAQHTPKPDVPLSQRAPPLSSHLSRHAKRDSANILDLFSLSPGSQDLLVPP